MKYKVKANKKVKVEKKGAHARPRRRARSQPKKTAKKSGGVKKVKAVMKKKVKVKNKKRGACEAQPRKGAVGLPLLLALQDVDARGVAHGVSNSVLKVRDLGT